MEPEADPHLENLIREQETWQVFWRWEGTSGHPRRIADKLADILEDQGYAVRVAEGQMRQEPIATVADFEGALIAERRQSVQEALAEHRFYVIVGILLLPLLLGLFFLWSAFQTRRTCFGIHWRGETYLAAARGGSERFSAERSALISDVRLTLRGFHGFGDPLRKGWLHRVEELEVQEFNEEFAGIVREIESQVPRLTSVPGD